MPANAVFTNKVAVITGASSGIGRALAVQLADAGARLALSDINAQGLEETRRLCGESYEVKTYRVDAANREQMFAHADEVERDFGGAHFVFNNAGATVVGTVLNTSIEEYEWQLNLNMYGVLYGTKAFLPVMLAQREGCIINISSIFGLLAFPAQSAYNMSKFAVRGLTECLWQELEGTGVRAISVHPGGIRTNIEKAGRRSRAAGTVEETFSSRVDQLLRTPPEECAADIIAGIRRGKHRILTGHMSRRALWLTRLLPDSYPRILRLLTR